MGLFDNILKRNILGKFGSGNVVVYNSGSALGAFTPIGSYQNQTALT